MIEYLKGKINALETNSENKNITELYWNVNKMSVRERLAV